MNYEFKTKKNLGDTVFIVVDKDNEQSVISGLTDAYWKPAKAQEIIDGVERNKTLSKTEDPYVWGNEDVTVFVNENGVLLIDKMAIRAKQEAEPLELTHNEFIDFMKDFKKFIEENS